MTIPPRADMVRRTVPRWSCATEVLIVGTGVAGLTCALDLAAAGLRVLLVTKAGTAEGSTRWAQGGVADPGSGDDLAGHVEDTLAAGAGVTDPEVAERILAAGHGAIRRLIGRGARFDTVGGTAILARTLEGGHRRARIIHAGGDATGAEIERALSVRTDLPAVLVGHQAVDLLLDRTGAVGGLTVLDDEGNPGEILAGAVVLATGGSSQLFASGTNPEVSTGDGLALALRAGAELVDVEFVQFHPTALWTPGARGRRPLVTEALRGAGAVLVDGAGRPVMAGVHPLGDLAPRDVVSLAITRRLATSPGGISDHVYLDARSVDRFADRFPTVAAACREIGAPAEAIPVSPAAHYHCGGIAVDADGRSTVPGLWAIGEVAGTGLHGANRLASNSLLEGLVGAEMTAAALRRRRPRSDVAPAELMSADTTWIDPRWRGQIQDLMTMHVGIGRTAAGLAGAMGGLRELAETAPHSGPHSALHSDSHVAPFSGPCPDQPGGSVAPHDSTGPGPVVTSAATATPLSFGAVVPDRNAVEVTNMMTAAMAVVATAAAREESRGCHVRLDHPNRAAPHRLRLSWGADGPHLRTVPVSVPVPVGVRS